MPDGATPPSLSLGHGLSYADLWQREGLLRLDAAWLEALALEDPALAERLLAARAAPEALSRKEGGLLMVALGPSLERFLAHLFGIEVPAGAQSQRQRDLAPLFQVKRLFVQRIAAKAFPAEQAAGFDGAALMAAMEEALGAGWGELRFARAVLEWQSRAGAEPEAAALLDFATRFAAWALVAPAAAGLRDRGVLFRAPHKLDFARLVPLAPDPTGPGVMLDGPLKPRSGFALTDPGKDLAGALDHAEYCIICHPQEKDSCARGLIDRRSGAVQSNPLKIPLQGCPLEERISEMHALKAGGLVLAPLAAAAVDNPMLAGTGHRICNDCMKACIYQRQEPVDIPQVESRVLKDVLDLPWGFEIYALLTRWNPLNFGRPLPRPPSGRTVLVVGLGPAGYTLAHHLLQDGHRVVAVDGLKLEPLPPALAALTPIRDAAALHQPLERRPAQGFGGVAEYGITVRWDKNNLTLLRLLLQRRPGLEMLGGVRLGSTVTLEQAFALGFDHVALCLGAGAPTMLEIPGGLAKGVRAASDFLMALQLTGAARAEGIANLQLRLPVVVIGGGLTAIDTATEALAYYAVQVRRFATRHRQLSAELGVAAVTARWSPEDAAIAAEFLAHAAALEEEDARAAAEGRLPEPARLIRGWGGVTIAYRRDLTQAPSYTLNHEEVALGLGEGIRILTDVTPVAIATDGFGAAESLRLALADGSALDLPARSVLIAAGTRPNTVLAREQPGWVAMAGRSFQLVDESGAPVPPASGPKAPGGSVLVGRVADGRSLSMFGDLHPSFAGNVVKAMASARSGHPQVTAALLSRPPMAADGGVALAAEARRLWSAEVAWVQRLTPTIVEVAIRAPAAAANFRPGQFFRLQNYEAESRRSRDTVLAMEGLAMTGAWTDPAAGLVGVIALEMGGSSDLMADLRPGEPVVLMGPTGTPTRIPERETVLLVGGGLGNAVLFSIGRAMREAGCRVLYAAGYRRPEDRFKLDQIEAAADVVLWATDTGPAPEPRRPQDRAVVANIVEALRLYGSGALGPVEIRLEDVQRMVVIGSDRMMAAMTRARSGVLAPFLAPQHLAIGSINSPMQCMMKEICAQCLQRHVDPLTGEARLVYSCFDQDQPLDLVDWGCLADRLGQNALLEGQTALWIARARAELADGGTAG